MRRTTSLLVQRAAAASACVAILLAPRVVAAPPRELIPPHWTAATVDWKATWDETLAANPDSAEAARIDADATVRGAKTRILAMRKIRRLEAMIQRFPAAREKFPEAYRTIADTWGQLGDPYQRSAWLLKLVTEFPQRKDLLSAACADMIRLPFSNPLRQPSVLRWESALQQVIRLGETGALDPADPAVIAAWTAWGQLLTTTMQYDRMAEYFRHLQPAAARTPALYKAAGATLASLGHLRAATTAYEKAKDPRADPLLNQAPRGLVFDLPRNRNLEIRWKALTRNPNLDDLQDVPPEQIGRILAAATDGGFLDVADTHSVSFWGSINRTLAASGGPMLQALRKAQNAAAAAVVADVRRNGDRDELVLLLRRYPWAACVHRTLLDFGERALGDGQPNWAQAYFRDVIEYGDDSDLRAAAQVGRWLSMAIAGDGAAVAAATASLPAGSRWPWRGGRVPIDALRPRLLAVASAAAPPTQTLAGIQKIRLVLGPGWTATFQPVGQKVNASSHQPWPGETVISTDKAVYVTGPDRVARFTADGTGPLWVRTAAGADAAAATPGSEGAAAGATAWWGRPALRPVAGTDFANVTNLYCIQRNPQPPALTALRADTGRLRWSTRDRPEWKKLRPLTAGIEVEGGLYLLAVSTERNRPAMSLVCLDVDDGTMRWNRPLGTPADARMDLADGGMGLTARNGALYCATNAGIVAACDLRDGQVQWVRGYSAAILQSRTIVQLSREGSPPVLSGHTLVVAPRDHTGLIAFDSNTGKTLWETVALPSDRIVGVRDGLVITAAAHWLAGVDIATGRPKWFHHFPEPPGSQAILLGGDIIVAAGDRRYRLAADSGNVLEQSQPAQHADQQILLPRGTCVELVSPSLSPGTSAVAAAKPIQLPLKKIWAAACVRPKLIAPDDDSTDTAALCVRSGRRLAGIKTKGTFEITWTRVLGPATAGIHIVGPRALLRSGHRITGIDMTTGRQDLSLMLPFVASFVAGDAKRLVLASAPRSEPWVAGVEVPTMKHWARPFTQGARLNLGRGIAGLTHRAASTGLFVSAAFADGAGKQGSAELVVDPASGRVREIRRVLKDLPAWPGDRAFSAGGICAIGPDYAATYLPAGGPAAAWKRKIDFSKFYKIWRDVTVRAWPSGGYVACDGNVFHFNRAAGREIVYALPKPKADAVQDVLDFRAVGETFVVVSAIRGMYIHTKVRKHASQWYVNVPLKISVDLFDRTTGRHLGRQELPGVTGAPPGRSFDYQAQARILRNAIIIADAKGLHVFAAGSR